MFAAKYSDAERDAMAEAYVDRRLRPRLIIELAADGELEYRGERLAAFEITNESTVRSQGAKLRKRRAGQLTSSLAQSPPREAIEALRRRIVSAADARMAELERPKACHAKGYGEELRQLARAVREAAAIPGADELRPPAPGARFYAHNGDETRGGLGASILAAGRKIPGVEPEPVPQSERSAVEPNVETADPLERHRAEARDEMRQWAAEFRARNGLPEQDPGDDT